MQFGKQEKIQVTKNIKKFGKFKLPPLQKMKDGGK